MTHAVAKTLTLRILVVEDHDDSRELMEEVLRGTGDHAIVLAKNAEEGLRALRSGVADMLVTDIGLPDRSGLEMLDQAIAEGLLAETAAVIVCSANESLRDQAIARGASFVSKPTEPEKIMAVVRRLSDPPRESGVELMTPQPIDGENG